MGAPGGHCSRQSEDGRFVINGDDFLDAGAALGERAGFVKGHNPHLRQTLQRRSSFDEHTMARTYPTRYHDGSGCGETEGTRAGNNQHCHPKHQGLGEWHAHDQPPHRKREQCDYDDDRHKNRRYLIDQLLYRGATALGLAHQADELCQHTITANRFSAKLNLGRQINRGADYALAKTTPDGQTFTRQHAFVHRRITTDQYPIDGNPFARFDNHNLAPAYLRGRHFASHTCPQHPGSFGL